RVLGVNVVSHPVGLLRFPYRSNFIFHNAPRAVSITNMSPSRLKAMPLATRFCAVPGGMVVLARPTPGSGTIPSKATLLFIGWIRNTSSQLTGGVVEQLAPGPAIFQTLPKPVVLSPVQRFPRRSNATPLAPGTPVANGIAVSGFRAFGARTHMIPPLAASAM